VRDSSTATDDNKLGYHDASFTVIYDESWPLLRILILFYW